MASGKYLGRASIEDIVEKHGTNQFAREKNTDSKQVDQIGNNLYEYQNGKYVFAKEGNKITVYKKMDGGNYTQMSNGSDDEAAMIAKLAPAVGVTPPKRKDDKSLFDSVKNFATNLDNNLTGAMPSWLPGMENQKETVARAQGKVDKDLAPWIDGKPQKTAVEGTMRVGKEHGINAYKTGDTIWMNATTKENSKVLVWNDKKGDWVLPSDAQQTKLQAIRTELRSGDAQVTGVQTGMPGTTIVAGGGPAPAATARTANPTPAPAPKPLVDFKTDADKKAYERFVSGQGNAGTGFKVVDNGATVTVTNNGQSTTYNQKEIDLDLKKAAEKSKAIIETPKGAGGTAAPAAPAAPVVTNPTNEQIKKYNALSDADKMKADAYFKGKGLTPGQPAAMVNNTNPNGAVVVTVEPPGSTGLAPDTRTKPTVDPTAPFVDVVDTNGSRITNITQAEAQKYTSSPGSTYVATPTGSAYVPEPKVNLSSAYVRADEAPQATQAQANAYNALDATKKAQADAYFKGLGLIKEAPKPTVGGGTATAGGGNPLPLGTMSAAGTANNGFNIGGIGKAAKK